MRSCRSIIPCKLEGVVNWRAFKQAVTGYNRIKNRKRDVLTLIDFSKPSTEKLCTCST